MRRRTAFITGGILGFAAGAASMLIAFPFLFPPPVLSEASPVLEGPSTDAVLEVGKFTFDPDAPGRDFAHHADGTGAVFRSGEKTLLRFDDNFRAGPGPNFWIYLNTVPVGEENAFNADAGRVKIAPLKSFAGGQNYTLPAGLDLSKFRTVTIWCESFGVYIASAPLPRQ
jgi:hypothetical protein